MLSKVTLVIILGSLVGLLPFKSVNAITLEFSQLGFSGGGQIKGSFSGNDINENDLLEIDELDSWFVEYTSGLNDITNSFLLSSSGEDGSLFSFSYGISNNSLNSFFTQAHNFQPQPSLEINSLITTVIDEEGNSNTSNDEIVLEVVPEPLTIFGGGTAIAFGAGFKRKLAKVKKK